MPTYALEINGTPRTVTAEADIPLLSILRQDLGLSGPRFGCGAGACGACRVLVGTESVAACDTPLWAVAGKAVTTVEGLGSEEDPHPLQRAFLKHQAMQCGYCVSGILISAAALLRRVARPSEAEIRAALDRNLCRCGAHNRMVRAILAASAEMAP
ncbi:(2Fe-2S)-binding protein [Aquabacter spiritensis]|uniref:Nicotinate dehydrogenase subunit A n=1 Tax=Aquabacter spiritensis TaxID=933073 RepID=A0A4R3LYQ2_9HYPH|nr:2Fe-2S iron-sulfur cluster-binding protein [Aquabacter spiritensis]TCT03847.1 nicotinate dehydrogenase subunit A [Aquabacter spiritensis]